jgi:ABC-2 type transport system ATP-binding protein
MSIVSARNLKKTFYSRITRHSISALDGVSIEVERGEIFGILGPNGAGKTTLLNCLSLLLQVDQGTIELFGHAIHKASPLLRMRLNMCSGNANFPWCMTVQELLKFYGFLYGFFGKSLNSRIEELTEALHLTPFLYRRFDELSTGTKQRLALAKSLLNNPELLFLDEPTVGLDPDVAIKIRKFIQELNQKKKVTILLTTHYMSEAEQLAQRVAFIHQGKVVSTGAPAALKQKLSATNMEEVFLQLSRQEES